MAAKKKPTNPRRGTVKKSGKKPAALKQGKAAAPKDDGKFDPKAVCDELNLHWPEDGGDNFVFKTGEDQWSVWAMKEIKKEIKTLPGFWVSSEPKDKERISEMDQVFLYARKNCLLNEIIPAIGGYRVGIHHLTDGTKALVRSSPLYVHPKQGEWPTIKALIEDRLNLQDRGGVDQTVYFHSWMRVAYSSLMNGKPGSFKPGQVLVLAGPVNSGKSRLQVMIITPMLGGRSGDPTAYLMGEDGFNKDLVGSAHWQMEELPSSSWGASDKSKLSENLKRAAVNADKRMRLMRTDPRTVQPFVRVSLTINDDPDKMRAFPPLTPDFADKVIMLKVTKKPMPMPTETEADQEAFNAQVAAELPAYAWWLMNEFEIPEALKIDPSTGERQTRFGFCSYHDPELVSQLQDDLPSTQLLRLIDLAWFEPKLGAKCRLWDLKWPLNTSGHKERGGAWVNAPDVWRGGADDLEALLCGQNEDVTSSVAKAALRLLGKGGIPTMLSRLKEDRFDRVAKADRGDSRGWAIAAPANAAET